MREAPVNKLKISLVIDELATGGAQRFFLLLSRELARKGHEVDLVVLSDGGALYPDVDDCVNVVNLNSISRESSSLLVGLKSLIRLMFYIRKRRPDGILSTLTGMNLLSVLAWSMAGRPGRLILREATSLKNVNSKLRLLLMSVLYKRASFVVALASIHARELRAELQLNEKQLRVIGNPTDTEHLDACAENIDDSFVRHLKPFILSVGRLTPAKDFASLIRAYSLFAKIPDVPKLVIVGDGLERDSLTLLVQDLSLENKVFLVGNQSCPSIWYYHAKSFVLSSLWEGYPNALLEAIYFNLPVVLTLYDESIQEIVNDLKISSVEYAKPGNPEDIARALKILVDMKGQGKIVVEPSQIVKSYEELLEPDFDQKKL